MTSVAVAPKPTEKQLEKYREWNVDFDWYENTYEDFTTAMKLKGVSVNEIYFSGFWSQGDGACFDGDVWDITKLVDMNDYPTVTALLAEDGEVSASITQSGHYYHEMCTEHSFESDTFEQVRDAPTEFHESIIEALDKVLDDEIENLETEVVDTLRESMRTLYKSLQTEYEHRTSDEQVTEAILEFDLD